MPSTVTCACGKPFIASNGGRFRICTHCDMPALHKAATCVHCRNIKVTRP